jgi:hypothetical protein
VEQNQLDNTVYFVFFLSNVVNLSNIHARVGKPHSGLPSQMQRQCHISANVLPFFFYLNDFFFLKNKIKKLKVVLSHPQGQILGWPKPPPFGFGVAETTHMARGGSSATLRAKVKKKKKKREREREVLA